MTPAEAAVDVQFASRDEIESAVEWSLRDAGVSLGDLKEQARTSRFQSEKARRAWFVISSFLGNA